MPKTAHPGDLRPVALRRVVALTTASAVTAAALAGGRGGPVHQVSCSANPFGDRFGHTTHPRSQCGSQHNPSAHHPPN